MEENIYIYIKIYICTYVIGPILKYMPKMSISTEANGTTICFAPSLHIKDAD